MHQISVVFKFLILCSFYLISIIPASATPLSFHEEFSNENPSYLYLMTPDDEVEFSFDLLEKNKGFHLGDTILEATLQFNLSAGKINSKEKIIIKTGIDDGDKILHEKEYNLTFIANDLETVELELDTLDILDYLQEDGRLTIFTNAPNLPSEFPIINYNSFYIESAELFGTYEPVPEPTSIFLLGTGLIFSGMILRKISIKHGHKKIPVKFIQNKCNDM